jgi:hypothetical protein
LLSVEQHLFVLAFEANMARYDDLNTTMIGYYTVLSALFLVPLIIALQALAYNWQNAADEAKLAGEYTQSAQVISEQLGSLSGYLKVDEAAPVDPNAPPADPNQPPVMVKRLQIPIQRAMELVLQEKKAPAPQAAPGT